MSRGRAGQRGLESQSGQPSDEVGGASARRPNRKRDRKIRVTLDLTREQHRFLRRFALDAEADASSILRALLALLEEDAALAANVRALLEPKYAE
jgi:hypothetical protein